MKVRSIHWLAPLLAGMVMAAAAIAEDARPQTDEKCVEQCDVKSDECMADADSDRGKQQACDDRYSECLQACE